MHMPRLFSDPDGISHIGKASWPLTDARYCEGPDGYTITEAWPSTRVRLIRTPAGYVDDWHPVPEPMISVLLSGRLRVEVSDGTNYIMETGDMVYCDDTHGQGHKMNEVDGNGYDMLLVALPIRSW